MRKAVDSGRLRLTTGMSKAVATPLHQKNSVQLWRLRSVAAVRPPTMPPRGWPTVVNDTARPRWRSFENSAAIAVIRGTITPMPIPVTPRLRLSSTAERQTAERSVPAQVRPRPDLDVKRVRNCNASRRQAAL